MMVRACDQNERRYPKMSWEFKMEKTSRKSSIDLEEGIQIILKEKRIE